MEHKVIVIAGPTASGKTALALKWAERLGTEIINFDSRQIYQELRIGVARPEELELAQIPHHFMGSHSIESPMNAAKFSELARAKALELIEKYGSVVLVGGTGLYLNAFLNGLDEFPEVSPELRQEVNDLYEADGISGISLALYALDPNAFEWVQKDNPARLMRALEITKASGKPVSEWRKNEGVPFSHPAKVWAIEVPRKQLYERINARVDEMVAQGLEAEVKGLLAYKDLPVMRTVGYSEYFDYFDGKLSQEQAVSLIKQKTRNYAKRQITWFKNKTSSEWLDLNSLENLYLK